MIAHRGFLLRGGPPTRLRVGLTSPPQADAASPAARCLRRVVCAARCLERFTRRRAPGATPYARFSRCCLHSTTPAGGAMVTNRLVPMAEARGLRRVSSVSAKRESRITPSIPFSFGPCQGTAGRRAGILDHAFLGRSPRSPIFRSHVLRSSGDIAATSAGVAPCARAVTASAQDKPSTSQARCSSSLNPASAKAGRVNSKMPTVVTFPLQRRGFRAAVCACRARRVLVAQGRRPLNQASAEHRPDGGGRIPSVSRRGAPPRAPRTPARRTAP